MNLDAASFTKLGQRAEMEARYDILNAEMQSHQNVFCSLVNNKRTLLPSFCKAVVRSDKIKGEAFSRAL